MRADGKKDKKDMVVMTEAVVLVIVITLPLPSSSSSYLTGAISIQESKERRKKVKLRRTGGFPCIGNF